MRALNTFFNNKNQKKARPDDTLGGCHVAVHVAVPFSRFCIAKGIISGQASADCRAFFSEFLGKVQLFNMQVDRVPVERRRNRHAIPRLTGRRCLQHGNMLHIGC